MLHSTQTTKKHTGNLILRFGMAGLLAAGLFFSAPYSAAAETVPSAENTDAGEITIHFTHYDAQDLEFYLNTDQAALAFTDATLTFQDSQWMRRSPCHIFPMMVPMSCIRTANRSRK